MDASIAGVPILACEQVHLLPLDQQCQFVKTQCGDHPGFINSFTLYYCLAQSETARHWIVIPILTIILLILFGSIGLVAGDCLVPNVNAITSHLKIPENISGLTLLAFANGSPDIISTYTSFRTGNVMLAFGEIIGASYFINSVVIGTVFLIKPFDLVPLDTSSASTNGDGTVSDKHRLTSLNAKYTYIRDVLFFTTAAAILLSCVRDGVLTRFEMIVLVLLYISYVALLLFSQWYFKRRMNKLEVDEHARGLYTNTTSPLAIEGEVEFQDSFSYNPQVIRNLEFDTILSGLATTRNIGYYIDQTGRPYRDDANTDIDMNELEAEIIEPPRKSLVHKAFDVVVFPLIKLFHYTVPVMTSTDYEGDYKPGLSKLFELLISLVVSPFILVCAIFPDSSKLLKSLVVLSSLGLTYLSYHNLIRSSNPLPLVKCLVSLQGVFASISWISIIAAEIISILTLVSSLTYIRPSALGITIFAMGNSVGDLISCIVITKMGYPLMALAACIGGPLLNMLMGLGMSGLLVGVDYIEISASISIVFCILGLLLNLIVVLLIVVPLGGWRFDKYVGLAMIFLWFVGVSVAILLEIVLSY